MSWFWWIPISVVLLIAGIFVLLCLTWLGIITYGIVRGWIGEIIMYSRKDFPPITDHQARRVIWRNYYRRHPE